MEPHIRPIRLSDVEGFRNALNSVAKERRYLLTTEASALEKTTNFVRNNIHNNTAQYVAELRGEIIGWVDIVPREQESVRHTGTLGMGIVKQHRGRGLGGKLLARAIQHAWDSGLTRLELEVFKGNTAAIALYEKHGYQHEGTRRYARLIDGNYTDILVMAQYRI